MTDDQLRAAFHKAFQNELDVAGERVPLYDMPFALQQYAFLFLGGPRRLVAGR